MKKLIVLTAALFFLFGCASATIIKSNPPGAKLYLDEELKGETPYTYQDKSPAGKSRIVTLKKEGYRDFIGQIKRNKFSPGAFVGGMIFIIPLIWITEYPSEYTFEMEKL